MKVSILFFMFMFLFRYSNAGDPAQYLKSKNYTVAAYTYLLCTNNDDVECIKALGKLGVNPSERINLGSGMLPAAFAPIEKNKISLLEAFREAGANYKTYNYHMSDPSNAVKVTALTFAIAKKNVAAVKKLLDMGADVTSDLGEEKVIHFAADSASLEIYKEIANTKAVEKFDSLTLRFMWKTYKSAASTSDKVTWYTLAMEDCKAHLKDCDQAFKGTAWNALVEKKTKQVAAKNKKGNQTYCSCQKMINTYQKIIDDENEAGQISGMVNKVKLYDAGKMVKQARDLQKKISERDPATVSCDKLPDMMICAEAIYQDKVNNLEN